MDMGNILCFAKPVGQFFVRNAVNNELHPFCHYCCSFAAAAASFAASARSCSIICLLQLTPTPTVSKAKRHPFSYVERDLSVLSTREKPPLLRHPRPIFPLRTDAPCHRRDPKHDHHHYRRVGLPIGRLRIPPSRRRPDVLRVSEERERKVSQRSQQHGGNPKIL